MNKVTVHVPDEKMQAFDEAMRNLGIERKPAAEMEIPEEHKNLVRKIIAENNPIDYRDWREVIEEIRNRQQSKP